MASSASTSDSRAANSLFKSQEACTYAMCKEIRKEMLDSILCGINERFDAFENKFEVLFTMQANLQKWLADQEQATSFLDICKGKLETKFKELKEHTGQLQSKVLDLDACFCRFNIKVVGIKEESEEETPRTLCLAWSQSCWVKNISRTRLKLTVGIAPPSPNLRQGENRAPLWPVFTIFKSRS